MVSVEYDGDDVSRATETGTARSCTLPTQLAVCQKGTMTTTLELNQGIRCTLSPDTARHVQVQSEDEATRQLVGRSILAGDHTQQ
jgi:hypothetical protein